MCYFKQEPEKEASVNVPKAAISQPTTWDGLQKRDGPQTLPSNFTELQHVYSLVLKIVLIIWLVLYYRASKKFVFQSNVGIL